jgi:hypothetical protein
MRELMGYLVARNGGEDTAACAVAGIPGRILRRHLCRQFVRKRFLRKADRAGHAWTADRAWIDESIGAGSAIGQAPGTTYSPTDTSRADAVLTDDVRAAGVRTGSPITIIYSRETFVDDAIAEIAGAVPDLSPFDCGARAGQAAIAGARRT